MLSTEFSCAGFSVERGLPVPSKRAGHGAEEGGAPQVTNPTSPGGGRDTEELLEVTRDSGQLGNDSVGAAGLGLAGAALEQ